MQFLKTLFWVLLAVVVALFAKANWQPVTVKLWNDIVADVQLPLLLVLAFLLGWLPTWLILRARIWSLNRRIEALDRNRAALAVSPEAVSPDPEMEPEL
jgi:lipopolysaccharide assembly protein A